MMSLIIRCWQGDGVAGEWSYGWGKVFMVAKPTFGMD